MKNKKIISIVLIFLSLLVGLFVYSLARQDLTRAKEDIDPIGKTSGVTSGVTQIVKPVKEKIAENKKNSEQNFQSVTVLAGDVTAHLQIALDTIFYDALVQAKNAGTITFSGKNYTGLGFFVTDIGTLRAGGGKNLIYYVNGKEAIVGVSSYTLEDGDIIEWKLE